MTQNEKEFTTLNICDQCLMTLGLSNQIKKDFITWLGLFPPNSSKS